MAGQSFTVLTYAAHVGEFDEILGLQLGDGKTFDVAFGATSLTLTTADITGLSISPSPIVVDVGASMAAAALAALDVGGPTDVSSSANWLSDDPAVALVDVDGTVHGIAEGTTIVRVMFDAFEAQVTVTVGGADIPAVSTWGLIVMALLVLTAGTLVHARRRPDATA